MNKPLERRRAPRRPVKVQATQHLGGSESERVSVTDLSQGGLFVQTKRRSTLGESFEVEFAAHDVEGGARSIRARCEVARVTPEGLGAYFTHLDPDSALLLNLMLAV